MSRKFKVLIAMFFVLFSAQAVAGERMVDFQRVLQNHEQQREPNQEKEKAEKEHLENPEIEVKVKEEKKESHE
ncbi:MAG: hypothetical protein CME64_13290 [Halobacteriovoraceae bacterium]|nr:hypothetical protein [Halobacteriovoraceae bacterium]|tara:strand:+ start:37625 stop:37843 length:219 start_codon:yes stop_codon:yes gene_type:complete